MDVETGEQTLVDVIQHWARVTGDRVAATYLVDGEVGQEISISYAELDRRARAIAQALLAHAKHGDRALLLFPSGLDFLASCLGCFYAGVIAVPAAPPMGARVERALPRLRSIASDARPAVVLATTEIRGFCEGPLHEAVPDLDPEWIDADTLPPEKGESWKPPPVDANSLAVLQYTSGSTSTPRGVMVSHGNLLANLRIIQALAGVSAASVCLTWLPHFHDMGLVGGLLEPLFAGSTVFLLSPTAFLRRPGRWLRAISHYRATHSGGPNFAFDLAARKIRPGERTGLDLSSWLYAYNGAEPINPRTLDRFVEAFAPHGFRRTAFCPCYGMAETTLVTTSCALRDAPVLRDRPPVRPGASPVLLVGCGKPAGDMRIEIVDPETRLPRPDGEEGEIWIAGSSVAQGYWNREEDTKATFHARLAWAGEGPFLRSGDLGVRVDGELYVTGRIKDLIILEGLNHYPQDIERTVEEADAAVRAGGAAAFTTGDDEGEPDSRLVLAVELEKAPVDPNALASRIRWAVSDAHRIRVDEIVFLRHGGIPKTSSGKVQRRACRDAFREGTMKTWKGLPA